MHIDMNINRREISVQPANRIKKITKQADGSMAVEYGSGRKGVIPEGETDMQAFAVFSVLADI
jgi:hypothetical protein